MKLDTSIGTHLDAPSHFIKGGKNIDDIPIENLCVPACILDVTEKAHPSYKISVQDIEHFEELHGPIPKNSLIIAHTGWYKRWHDKNLYRNELVFPDFSEESIRKLLQRDIAGIGIDTLSPDATNFGFPVHHLILGNGKYILENLTNLHLLPSIGAFVLALPIKIKNGTEAPARVIGLIPKKFN